MSAVFWIIIVCAVAGSGVFGYLMGRRNQPASAEDIEHIRALHEQQLMQKQAEFDAYREEVHQHHEKTANLFVSMAAPYREMFDHLSEGYDRLGDFTQHKILPERPGALLDGPDPDKVNNPFDQSIAPEPIISAQPQHRVD